MPDSTESTESKPVLPAAVEPDKSSEPEPPGPTDAIPPPQTEANEAEQDTDDVMILDTDVKPISELSMSELRSKLRNVGLSSGGKREALIQRYTEYCQNNESIES